MPKPKTYSRVGDPRRYIVTYRGDPAGLQPTEQAARARAQELAAEGKDSVNYWQIIDYPYANLGQYLHYLGSGDEDKPAVTGVGT